MITHYEKLGIDPKTKNLFMSNNLYFIVPNSNPHNDEIPASGYYDMIPADSKEEALIKFAETMDTNMSAYFDALEKKPVYYPHGYQYPEGKFETALTIIIATFEEEKSSAYYVEGGLEGVNLAHMNVIGSLQRSYEELKKADKSAALKSRKYFYKVLRDITGFEFDEENKPDPDEKIRIKVDFGDRIMITRKDLKRVSKAFTKAGIDYEII